MGQIKETLIVTGFPKVSSASRALTRLLELEEQHLIEIRDAVVVHRSDDGKLRSTVRKGMIASGALQGALWGLLLGSVFLVPLIGVLYGAVTGALAAALSDHGVHPGIVAKTARRLEPGTSALFLLIGQATPDKVLAQLHDLKGWFITTSLSVDKERKLRALWRKVQEEGPLATYDDDRRTRPLKLGGAGPATQPLPASSK